MGCSPINELPPSVERAHGWPWTQESKPLPQAMPDGTPWPKVTIVTPSFNQGWALEQTLRSVLLQDYPCLDYIVMDGGSSDNSLEVIRKYEPWLSHWQSEPDGGQSAAINEGFRRANTEWVAWINSDDYYMPGALQRLGQKAAEVPADCVVIAGPCDRVDRDCNWIMCTPPKMPAVWPDSWILKPNVSMGLFYQPATLIRRSAFWEIGGLRERLHYGMDYDLWIRLSRIGTYALVDGAEPVASARVYSDAKSCRGDIRQTVEGVYLLFDNGCESEADSRLLSFADRMHSGKIRALRKRLQALEDFDGYLESYPLSRIAKYTIKRMFRRAVNAVRKR